MRKSAAWFNENELAPSINGKYKIEILWIVSHYKIDGNLEYIHRRFNQTLSTWNEWNSPNVRRKWSLATALVYAHTKKFSNALKVCANFLLLRRCVGKMRITNNKKWSLKKITNQIDIECTNSEHKKKNLRNTFDGTHEIDFPFIFC